MVVGRPVHCPGGPKPGSDSNLLRNDLRVCIGVEQVGSLKVPKVALAVVAIADQASGRAVGEGLEPGPKFSALALNFHIEIDLRGVRNARLCRLTGVQRQLQFSASDQLAARLMDAR